MIVNHSIQKKKRKKKKKRNTLYVLYWLNGFAKHGVRLVIKIAYSYATWTFIYNIHELRTFPIYRSKSALNKFRNRWLLYSGNIDAGKCMFQISVACNQNECLHNAARYIFFLFHRSKHAFMRSVSQKKKQKFTISIYFHLSLVLSVWMWWLILP